MSYDAPPTVDTMPGECPREGCFSGSSGLATALAAVVMLVIIGGALWKNHERIIGKDDEASQVRGSPASYAHVER